MDQAVFRALGDPTRRRILDLLRDGPHTTGDLAEQFEQSRYGVMKHLSVLEEARLVVVERQGRKRYNHLNAVPLRELYERWLGPYQEFWSTSLLRMRDVVAGSEPSSTEEKSMSQINSFEIKQTVTFDAKPEQVWAALTTDIGKWWAYHVGEAGSTISLDARLGGHFEERWGDGEGVVWGEVVDLRKGKRLRLRGCLGMSGAGTNDYTYELSPDGDKTVLELTHYSVGYADPEAEQSYRDGWKGLFGKYLTAWLSEGTIAAELDAATSCS
jgi:DNA-binding transcriptional ArsR family regulator/uncharacterized protein YndB with AHSA1/START domain